MKAFSQPFRPDISEMLDVLFRRRLPKRVHHVELFLDEEIKNAVIERFELCADLNRSDRLFEIKRDVALSSFLGYDMFRVGIVRKTVFHTATIAAPDTTAQRGQKRAARDWQEEHAGLIQSWKDFDSYHWPQVSDIDFVPLEWLERNHPPTMGCYRNL